MGINKTDVFDMFPEEANPRDFTNFKDWLNRYEEVMKGEFICSHLIDAHRYYSGKETTDHKVKVMKIMREYGYTFSEIGERFGITRQAVHELLNK